VPDHTNQYKKRNNSAEFFKYSATVRLAFDLFESEGKARRLPMQILMPFFAQSSGKPKAS